MSVSSDAHPCTRCGVLVWTDTSHTCTGHSNLSPAEMTARLPHICPICAGRGRVARDFYGETMNASEYIACQSCHGLGVLWAP